MSYIGKNLSQGINPTSSASTVSMPSIAGGGTTDISGTTYESYNVLHFAAYTGSGDHTITVSSSARIWVVLNDTALDIGFKTATGTITTVYAGEKRQIMCDGSNVVDFQLSSWNTKTIDTPMTVSNENGWTFVVDGRLYVVHGSSGSIAFDTAGISDNASWGAIQGLLDGGFVEVPFPAESATAKVIDVSVHTQAYVAVLFDSGNLYAYGLNSFGQVGDGTTTGNYLPYLTDTNVTDIFYHGTNGGAYCTYSKLVYRKSDGYIYACGYNANGQLGVGDTATRSTPTQLTSLGNSIKSVWNNGTNNGNMFVQKNDGTIWACGYNGQGQLGTGNTTNQTSLVDVTSAWGGTTAGDIIKVTGGFGYYDSGGNASGTTVMLRKTAGGVTSVYTCGAGNWGALGNGATANISTPYLIPSSGSVADICANGGGPLTVHMLNTDGSLYGWGYNNQGCVGVGTTTNVTSPTLIDTSVDKLMIDGADSGNYSYYNQSFYRKNGKIYGMGRNANAELGVGQNVTTFSSPTLIRLPAQEIIEEMGYWITSGSGRTYMARAQSGKIYAWGYNSYNAFTSLASTNIWSPMEIPLPGRGR